MCSLPVTIVFGCQLCGSPLHRSIKKLSSSTLEALHCTKRSRGLFSSFSSSIASHQDQRFWEKCCKKKPILGEGKEGSAKRKILSYGPEQEPAQAQVCVGFRRRLLRGPRTTLQGSQTCLTSGPTGVIIRPFLNWAVRKSLVQ